MKMPGGKLGTLALAILAGMAATRVEAREGFYLGFGFAGSSATSGGFNGTNTQTDTPGNQYEQAKIGSGPGIGLDAGYNFTNYFGLEYFSTATTQTATFSGQPDSSTTVGLGLLGVRLIALVAKSSELFLRLGEAVGIVDMDNGGLVAGTKPTPVRYTGSGSGYGVGFEILGDHFGLGVGYTAYDITFNQAKINGQSSFTLTSRIHETFDVTDITFAYHFK
jgi:hypothetical protein